MSNSHFSKSIRQFRELVLELSQVQFAALLGMGVASINRVENGADPTPAHRFLLEAIQEPSNLMRALKGKDDVLGDIQVTRLKKVAEELFHKNELQKIAQYQLLKWSKVTSGREGFELEKFTEMVKFFATEGEWKTKLNKLLFYSDFLAFKELKSSISGARYVIGTFGPIPDKQDALYSALTEAGELETREKFLKNTGEPVEMFFACGHVDRRLFKSAELNILERVKRFFLSMTAKQVADYSHEESFYQEGELGEAIPYSEVQKMKDIPDHETKNYETKKQGDKLPFTHFEDIVSEISSQVPLSEWSKLPSDGSQNIDAYLYGAKKVK